MSRGASPQLAFSNTPAPRAVAPRPTERQQQAKVNAAPKPEPHILAMTEAQFGAASWEPAKIKSARVSKAPSVSSPAPVTIPALGNNLSDAGGTPGGSNYTPPTSSADDTGPSLPGWLLPVAFAIIGFVIWKRFH